MARVRRLTSPVTLFAAVESEQHETLRSIAFREHRSLADVVREAIEEFIRRRAGSKKAARA